MRRCAAFLVVTAIAAAAQAGEVNLSVIAGGQVLEQKIDVLRPRLQDEVTLGRSVLGGLSLGLRLGDRHHLAIEGVIGPYHDDVERSCPLGIYNLEPCTLKPWVATSFAIHYSAQYSYSFRSAGTSPFVGAGIGGKHYDYDDASAASQTGYESGSLTSHAAVGVELASRLPVRLETRFVVVWSNPYLQEAAYYSSDTNPRQYELQLRASVRLPLVR